MKLLDPRFRGNVPALVTPCNDAGDPDLTALHRLVDFVVERGVDAFNILGTTGEFSLVAPRHRRAIIEAAVAAARGRVPVMVGCGRPSVEETSTEIEEAGACGAAAVLVTPSYYFQISDEEVVRFFSMLAKGSVVPLLYYHIPQLTRVPVAPATVARLAVDGIVAGVKDSGGDAAFLSALLAQTESLEDFRTFLGGSAFLLGALALGVHGVTGALSNFAPHLDRELLDAFASGDMPRAHRAQAAIVRANETIFLNMRRNPAVVTKAVLAKLGICSEAVFPPLAKLEPGERKSILDSLPTFGI